MIFRPNNDSNKIHNEIEDVKRFGLGENIIYITYMREGILEKIVIHKKAENEKSDRFKFKANICLTCPI